MDAAIASDQAEAGDEFSVRGNEFRQATSAARSGGLPNRAATRRSSSSSVQIGSVLAGNHDGRPVSSRRRGAQMAEKRDPFQPAARPEGARKVQVEPEDIGRELRQGDFSRFRSRRPMNLEATVEDDPHGPAKRSSSSTMSTRRRRGADWAGARSLEPGTSARASAQSHLLLRRRTETASDSLHFFQGDHIRCRATTRVPRSPRSEEDRQEAHVELSSPQLRGGPEMELREEGSEEKTPDAWRNDSVPSAVRSTPTEIDDGSGPSAVESGVSLRQRLHRPSDPIPHQEVDRPNEEGDPAHHGVAEAAESRA